MKNVVVVELQNQRDFARVARRRSLEKPQRGGVGVAARRERQLEVVIRVVAGGVRGEAARRAVLEALVHGEDDELAGAGEAAVVQQARQVGFGAWVVALVPAQNFLHAVRIPWRGRGDGRSGYRFHDCHK